MWVTLNLCVYVFVDVVILAVQLDHIPVGHNNYCVCICRRGNGVDSVRQCPCGSH